MNLFFGQRIDRAWSRFFFGTEAKRTPTEPGADDTDSLLSGSSAWPQIMKASIKKAHIHLYECGL